MADGVVEPETNALPVAAGEPDTVDVVERDVTGDAETRALLDLIAVDDGEFVLAAVDEASGESDVAAVVVDDADGDRVDDDERERTAVPVGKGVAEPLLDSRALLETLVVREAVALPSADAVTDPVSDTVAVALALLLLAALLAELPVEETLPLSLAELDGDARGDTVSCAVAVDAGLCVPPIDALIDDDVVDVAEERTVDDNDETKLTVTAVDGEGAPLVDGTPEVTADILKRGDTDFKAL